MSYEEKTKESTSANVVKTISVHSSTTLKKDVEGHGESAIPADKKEEEVENIQDDWEDDPANARNWSPGKKCVTVAIVSSPCL